MDEMVAFFDEIDFSLLMADERVFFEKERTRLRKNVLEEVRSFG